MTDIGSGPRSIFDPLVNHSRFFLPGIWYIYPAICCSVSRSLAIHAPGWCNRGMAFRMAASSVA